MLNSKYSFLEDIINSMINLENAEEDNFSSEEAINSIINIPDGWEYDYGVSKLVLIPDEYNFVVKIPFSCMSWTDYDEDDNEEDKIAEFQRAYYIESGEYGWDYCRAEAEFYEAAKVHRVEKFFAPTIYIGDIKGWPIYIQDKCLIFEESNSRYSHSQEDRCRSREKLDSMKIASERVPIDFIVDMFKDYPDEEVADVFNFIEDARITDLHGHNCGYNKDGLVVFTDYSGYDD